MLLLSGRRREAELVFHFSRRASNVVAFVRRTSFFPCLAPDGNRNVPFLLVEGFSVSPLLLTRPS